MIDTNKGDYWRMRDVHGIVHYNARFTNQRMPRCGSADGIRSLPGSVGPEGIVTCLLCIGHQHSSFAPSERRPATSSTQPPCSPTTSKTS